MIYIGTKKQKEIIKDIIEDIETGMVYAEDHELFNKMMRDRDFYQDVLEKKFAIVNIQKGAH